MVPSLSPWRLGKAFQIGAPGHRPVLVEDLDEDRGGLESGETRQVAAGLGVPGAGEHARRLRHQREDVAGLHEIRRRRIGPDRGEMVVARSAAEMPVVTPGRRRWTR